MGDVWGEGHWANRRQLVFDLTVTAVIVLVAVAMAVSGSVASVVAAVLLAAAFVARRFDLRLMAVLGLVAALVQVATAHVAGLADLAYAPLFFALGADRNRRVRVFGLAAGLVAVVVAGVWSGAVSPEVLRGDSGQGLVADVMRGVVVAVMAALVCLGGWVAGLVRFQNRSAVQARVDAQLDEAERRRLAEAFEQEAERTRIAADMHDVVAHSWAVVAAQADGARYALRSDGDLDPSRFEQALQIIGDTARSAIDDLGTILARLRYEQADEGVPGPRQQAALLERMTVSGLTVELDERGTADASPLLAITAYRLLAEALTNALKHGDTMRPVTVRQDWTCGYELTVVNALGTAGDGTGHGVVSMRQRAELAGGSLAAHRVGDTWVVHARIPDDSPPGVTPGDDS